MSKNIVKFIRSSKMIPNFNKSPYSGKRYEDMVPDTLDIQERCTLAINGLTGPTDPDKDYLLYFTVNLNAKPPVMWHTTSDLCQIKFMEALPLMRPEWVKPDETTCRVNGRQRNPGWENRYAVIGNVAVGDVVQITFLISERLKEVDIEKRRYILIIKGNEVVNIDPPGRFCPYYQRDHYRENTVRWKKVNRFISKEYIYW